MADPRAAPRRSPTTRSAAHCAPTPTGATTTTWTWDTAPRHGARRARHGRPSPNGDTRELRVRRPRPARAATLPVGGEALTATLEYDAARAAVDDHLPRGRGQPAPSWSRTTTTRTAISLAVRDAKAPSGTAPTGGTVDADDAGRVRIEAFGNGVVTTRDYFEDKQRIKSILTTALGATRSRTSRTSTTSSSTSPEGTTRSRRRRRTSAFATTRSTGSRARPSARGRRSAACAGARPGRLRRGRQPDAQVRRRDRDFAYGDPAHPHAVTKAGGQDASATTPSATRRSGRAARR